MARRTRMSEEESAALLLEVFDWLTPEQLEQIKIAQRGGERRPSRKVSGLCQRRETLLPKLQVVSEIGNRDVILAILCEPGSNWSVLELSAKTIRARLDKLTASPSDRRVVMLLLWVFPDTLLHPS